MDFPINLKSTNKDPLRKQIGTELRKAIRSRRVRSGDKLPSSRQLAEVLGISRDTVVRAYQDLLAAGFLETKSGGRTVVRKNASSLDTAPPTDVPASSALERRSSPPPLLSGYAQRLACSTSPQPVDQLRLDCGAAPRELLPTKQWRSTLSQHCPPKQRADDAKTTGNRRLREAIASYLKRSKAIDCHPDQILVLSDSQLAADLVSRILVDPGDIVAVENPGYWGTRETLLSYGAQLQPVPIDGQGLVTAELAKVPEACKLVCVTPSHHDPVGVVMSQQRRAEILEWARRRNAYIVEDGCDSDYRYGGQAIPAIQGLDADGSVIYIYSFWKTLFPLSSVGCLVLPPQLVDIFTRAKQQLLRDHATVEHHALADFIAGGHLERHIWRTRSIYATRRRTLISELYKRFGDAVSVAKASAGLHMMVRLNVGIPDDGLARLAGQAGLRLVSTGKYYMANPQKGEFLVRFADMTEENIKSAVDCLAKLVKEGERV